MTSSTQFEKILVPLDGSALSERAIEPALLIGRRSHSEIVLVRAPSINLNLVVAPNPHTDQLHTEIHNSLNDIQLTDAQPDVQRWVYGSVTEKVLRSAPWSVMIIRSPSPELN
jgi:nucleotide-binding universal stress UspA family protein